MPVISNTSAFTYPPLPHVRRHGPAGYKDYHSYRPWLRDEFTFRCVYCLIRERWGRVSGEFDLDHFVPQVEHPHGLANYDNLLYVCHACNLRKGKRTVPDAATTLTSNNIQVYPNGTIKGLTDDAQRMIRRLSLNSVKLVQWRRMWMRIVQLAKERAPDLYLDLMGYPDDLPDLAACDAPANTKPEGIDDSHLARRNREELPDTYLF